MQKPTFFTKILKTLRQLSTSKGFSIKQIADQLQQLCVKRDFKQIKSIVEKSLRYGVQKKLFIEKSGKYHLTPARIQSLRAHASEQKKKKRVRFKRGKTNINEALKKSKNKNCKTPSKSRRSQKSSDNQKELTSSSRSLRRKRRSETSKRGRKSKKRNEHKKAETSEQEKTSEQKSHGRRSPSVKKSETELIVENNDHKEPIDVTPERDVHDDCVNKNKNRKQQPNIREPPRLESETEIGWQPSRPSTRLSQRSQSSKSSTVRKNLKAKYKDYRQHEVEQKKRLKDLIPDDKMYRKYKTRSSYNSDREKSEECSDHDSSNKAESCRRCQHPNCKRHNHSSSDDVLLERKISNTMLDHLNQSKTVLDTGGENLTPFEGFQSNLETIDENMSTCDDEPTEDYENEAEDNFDSSYIN